MLVALAEPALVAVPTRAVTSDAMELRFVWAAAKAARPETRRVEARIFAGWDGRSCGKTLRGLMWLGL